MISIIIPCYNVDNYLQATVESVLNQTYSDFEIILINDGSIDNTKGICLELLNLDNRIVYTEQKNKGVSEARNNGLLLAKGDYVYFLDGDDTIDENLFNDIIKCFQTQDVDLISFGYNINDEAGNICKSYSNASINNKIFYRHEMLKAFLEKRMSQCMCSFIAKRTLFADEVRFPKGIKYGEDQYVQISLMHRSESSLYLSRPYFKYLKRSGSVINSEVNISRLDYLKSLNMFEQNTSLAEDIYPFFNNYRGVAFSYLLKEGVEGRAKEDFFKELSKYQSVLMGITPTGGRIFRFNYGMSWVYRILPIALIKVLFRMVK